MMRRPILRSLTVLALSLVVALSTAASEVDFRVTEVPAVTDVEAPKPLDRAALKQVKGLGMADLEKYAATARFEKFGVAPREMADDWRRLAKEAPSLAAMAEKRAGEWDAYATKVEEEFNKRKTAARDADWKRLGPLLRDGGESGEDKNNWAGQFLGAYVDTPGVSYATVTDIHSLLPPGKLKDGLADAASAGRFQVMIATVGAVRERMNWGDGRRIGVDALRKLHSSRDKAWQESDKGKAVRRAIEALDGRNLSFRIVEDEKGKTMSVARANASGPLHVYGKRFPDFTSLETAIPDVVGKEIFDWIVDDPESPMSAPYKAALEAIRGEEGPRP